MSVPVNRKPRSSVLQYLTVGVKIVVEFACCCVSACYEIVAFVLVLGSRLTHALGWSSLHCVAFCNICFCFFFLPVITYQVYVLDTGPTHFVFSICSLIDIFVLRFLAILRIWHTCF